jgi:tetratricopeptide (TPR) repeat protein
MAASAAELRTLSRLLDQALALDPAQRAGWLAGLCGSDAGHRDRLALMLADANSDDQFLATPAIGHWRASEPDQPAEQPGVRVGPYLLQRQIGSGGMGSVWLAQRADGALDRSVALKLPHVAWGPALNARLARERDILARLTHPNIARLYDAGTDEKGRPYLALEYVEGVPIDEFLRQKPRGLRERLALFKQVATAVAYAHLHLVVHRDLKPSNVLVCADGSAHLLDFGIAKLLGDEGEGLTQLTRGAGRMLTPGYASPEQIRGEPITVASDVYSLGVLLYEMLTGTRPFNVTGASLTDLEASVLREPAPLASSRVPTRPTQRALRGDLDTILAKCLRKEPEARYRTVDALIDDLDRHITGEPVLARPDSGWYRASRFIRRHSDYVALASAALVAVLIGLGVATVQAQRARTEARRAQAQAERADAVKDFVIGLFDLNHGDDPTKYDLRQLPADALVERGARLIAVRYEGRPALQAEMLGIAGTIFADIGDAKHAAEMANGQLAALGTAPGNDRERAGALRVLARAQLQELRYDLAEATLGEAIREAGSLSNLEVASLHASLARILRVRRKSEAAANHLNQAEALLKTPADRHTAVYSDILMNRALQLLWDKRDPAAARSAFDRAVTLTRELSGSPSAASIAQQQIFAGNLIQFGEIDAGRALYESLLADIRKSSGAEDLEAVSLELNLIERLNNLNALPDQGLPRIEQLVAILDGSRSGVPAALRAHADLVTGLAYSQRGEIDRAEAPMRRMLPILVEHPHYPDKDAPALGASQPVFGPKYQAMYWYALWADDRGEHEEATRLWDEIYRVRRNALYVQGVRVDVILDPEMYAIQSRIMAGDLRSAAQRLADVKTQLEAGRPAILNKRWDPRWEALALEVLIKIESGQFAEGAKLVRDFTGANPDPRVKDLTFNTFSPSGLAGLQAVLDCNTGRQKAGLAALVASLNESSDNAPNSPSVAALRARIGLCALQAGQPAMAREMSQRAGRAFTDQPGVSNFYKKPWLELERELGKRRLAAH